MAASQKPEPGNAVARRETQQTAVEKRQKDQRDALKDKLSLYAPSFAKVLPAHLTPERMVTLALVAATKTPKLFDCTPESIALSVMEVSRWGLDIGRTAHLVPFGNVCTPIADWKGLIELMIKSGHVRDVKARCVFANEHFRVIEGTDASLEHVPILDDKARGELIAAYAIAWLRKGGATFEVLAKHEVDKIRSGAVSKDSPAWKNHYPEMAKKTAVRRLAKRIPQSQQMQAALGMEVEIDGEFSPAAERMREMQQRIEADHARALPPRGIAGGAMQQIGGYDDTALPKVEPGQAADGAPIYEETAEQRAERLEEERLAKLDAEGGSQ